MRGRILYTYIVHIIYIFTIVNHKTNRNLKQVIWVLDCVGWVILLKNIFIKYGQMKWQKGFMGIKKVFQQIFHFSPYKSNCCSKSKRKFFLYFLLGSYYNEVKFLLFKRSTRCNPCMFHHFTLKIEYFSSFFW